LCQFCGTLEDFRFDIPLEHNTLDDAGAIADLDEVELATGTQVIDPPT
jgi:hypothetical protein